MKSKSLLRSQVFTLQRARPSTEPKLPSGQTMHATLLFSLALSVAAPGLKDAPKNDPTIVCEWVFESATVGGMAAPMDKAKLRVTFRADGVVTAKEGDEPTKEEHTYTIDAKKNPAEIDLTPRNQVNNNQAL